GRLFDADADETATALDELVAAGLVHADLPPRFIQPIVARAVYSSIPPGRRAQLHAQAALSSVGLHDSPDRVAPHLLAIPPAGDAKAVQILMAAAGQAMAAGAPGTAVRYLERALAEPPAEELRGGVLMMLGSVGSMIGASTALDHLSEAMEAASDPGQLAQAAYAFGLGMLFTGRMPFALGSLNRALDRLAAASPEVRRDVAELLLIAGETALQIRDSLRPDLDEAVQRVASDGLDASPALLAVAALELAMCHGDTARARELATRATDVESGLSAETPQLYLATGTLSIIGEHGASETRLNLALEEAQASGSARGVALVSCWRARNRLLRGALSECEEDVAAFNDLDRELDLVTFRALVKATHIDLLIEQGRLADAEAVAASIDWDREDDLTSFYAVVRESMGRLALERGHAEQALEFLEPLEGYEERWGDRGAVWTQWRPVAVRTHLQLGHARRAHGLAREHLEQALDVRVPRSIILGHRAVAATVDDEMAGKHLREAVSIADASGLLLEEAHAHAELGRLHQRIGSTDDAQQELRQAMDLAHRCGAFALRERAHRQLLDMGARPRRPHLSGPESLTASERRVVRLAMRGLSNRQIGQELMVTVKTVETHLTNSYRKLSISSRADLADAMGEGD
ncbi:MAG: LuxR C-terminal-related transcriptional regulator, partial [Nitriliruptorales bacterium]|nr:LuxR C-terminal-related transcriptional regulator [Nitriliruptorales bacterium]